MNIFEFAAAAPWIFLGSLVFVLLVMAAFK